MTIESAIGDPVLSAYDEVGSVARSALSTLRLRTVVHRYVTRTLDGIVRPPQPVYGLGVRTLRIGPDPIRVLLFGDSNAVGYGVASRDETNDRFLTDELAARTGRGVVLENRGVPHVDIVECMDSLGAAGTHSFHVAVWSPSFVEGVERLRMGGWRGELQRMIERLRAESEIPIVLCRMPLPTGPHYAVPMLRWGWRRLNRAIELAAAEFDGVHVAEVTDVPVPANGVPVVDVDTYRSTSRLIAPVVLRAIGVADRSARDARVPTPRA